jgi:hypothetical protein
MVMMPGVRIRRTGVVLVAVLATMVGVVTSTAAGVRMVRGSPYRIGSGFVVFSPKFPLVG